MRHIQAALAVIIATIMLAGCSRSGQSSSSASSAGSVERGAPAAGSARGDAGGGAAEPAAPAKAAGAPVPRLTSPALIRTAELTVTLAKAKLAAAADRAGQIATAAGGRVDADDRTTGDAPTAVLTLKVPNPELGAVLAKLGALGTETSRQLGTRDVTSQLVDVSSRVASAKAAIAQLNQLYRRATDVSDVISIETTLSQREADLESLEAQQHQLQAQTALATVTLRLGAAVPPGHDRRAGGFLGGLQSGWHGFVRTVIALGTAAGAVLPFAGVLALLAAAAVLLRRRLRHPRAAAEPEA